MCFSSNDDDFKRCLSYSCKNILYKLPVAKLLLLAKCSLTSWSVGAIWWTDLMKNVLLPAIPPLDIGFIVLLCSLVGYFWTHFMSNKVCPKQACLTRFPSLMKHFYFSFLSSFEFILNALSIILEDLASSIWRDENQKKWKMKDKINM